VVEDEDDETDELKVRSDSATSQVVLSLTGVSDRKQEIGDAVCARYVSYAVLTRQVGY
jgi:hypothetical protein